MSADLEGLRWDHHPKEPLARLRSIVKLGETHLLGESDQNEVCAALERVIEGVEEEAWDSDDLPTDDYQVGFRDGWSRALEHITAALRGPEGSDGE